MSEPHKKKYEAPKIYRVVLQHDQAILSSCSTTTTTTSTGTGAYCRASVCRKGTTSSADSNSSS